jgi:hypothetical protein
MNTYGGVVVYHHHYLSLLLLLIYLSILTANGFLLGGSGTTVRHNTQIAHTTFKQNAAHKTPQTIKDMLYTMNTM